MGDVGGVGKDASVSVYWNYFWVMRWREARGGFVGYSGCSLMTLTRAMVGGTVFLAAFLLFLLRICFVPELAALALAACGAWLYALVSGFNAPAVRAAGGMR